MGWPKNHIRTVRLGRSSLNIDHMVVTVLVGNHNVEKVGTHNALPTDVEALSRLSSLTLGHHIIIVDRAVWSRRIVKCCPTVNIHNGFGYRVITENLPVAIVPIPEVNISARCTASVIKVNYSPRIRVDHHEWFRASLWCWLTSGRCSWRCGWRSCRRCGW